MGFLSSIFGAKDNSKVTEAIQAGAFLVDVRMPSEFASGSVKGAVNIPLDKIGSQLTRFKGKKSIVVFCQSGNRSGQAKSILDQNGVQSVINGGSWSNVNKCIG